MLNSQYSAQLISPKSWAKKGQGSTSLLKQMLKTRQIGPTLLISAVVIAFYLYVNLERCNGIVGLKPLVSVPSFATTALSSLGLISLFVGLLYQRRFQRGDELIREVSLLREVLHPDYREQLGLNNDYTRQTEGLDPRYKDKHQRTVDTVRRFREYRQLFKGVPPYNVAFALVYFMTAGVALVFWLFSLSGGGWWEIIGHAAALAVTAESLWLVGRTLWLVSLFPHRGEDLTLEDRLGLPGWYKLLDVRYLRERFLPFGPFVAALECYLMLSRLRDAGRDEWVLYFQLPLPLREWEWHCTVSMAGKPIYQLGWERVSLTPDESNRFFTQPGFWMQTKVAAWAVDRVGPTNFDEVVVTLKLRGLGDSDVLVLTAPQSGSSWYQGEPAQGPMRYPWLSIQFGPKIPATTSDRRIALVLPQAGVLADQIER